MKIISISIPEEIRDFIQRCDIEQKSRRNIIINILNNNYNISKKRIEEYQEDYNKKFFIFEIAKQELEKQYIYPNINKNNIIEWKLDYNLCTIFVKVE